MGWILSKEGKAWAARRHYILVFLNINPADANHPAVRIVVDRLIDTWANKGKQAAVREMERMLRP